MIIIEKYMTDDLKLGGSELLVYADIASNLNAANEFTKLQQTLASDCGLSVKTVQRTLKILQERKLIKTNKARDGRRFLNIININDKLSGMIKDSDFNDILVKYNQLLNLHEDKVNKNYNAYKAAAKDPKWSKDEFIKALTCYADTINDNDYYKKYLYTFDKFFGKYKEYLPGGFEYKQYKIFYDKKLWGKFHSGDREYYIKAEDFTAQEDDAYLDSIEV